MAVFLVLPTDSEAGITEEFEQRLKTIVQSDSDLYMLPNKHGCFIPYSGTSDQLRNLLNLNGKNDPKFTKKPYPAVIVKVDYYSGFADKNLWEWLDTKA